MEEPPVAELLPELYRQVLDRVAALEEHGQRAEAGRVRADATRAYSRAWDTSTVGKLRALRIHAERVIVGRERPRAQHSVAAAIARFTLERPV
jgi:hypothetical protein